MSAFSSIFACGSDEQSQIAREFFMPERREDRVRHRMRLPSDLFQPCELNIESRWGPIEQVACGAEHTLVLLTTGRVLAFGDNKFGQLGLHTHSEKPQTLPRLIPFPLEATIVNVSAGNYHSVFISSSGQVFTCGLNRWGQCAGGEASFCTSPVLLASLPQPNHATILPITGPHSTFLWYKADHNKMEYQRLFAFGKNVHGNLGVKHFEGKRETIFKVPLPSLVIAKLVTDEHHSLLLSSDGDVYACGKNIYHELEPYTQGIHHDFVKLPLETMVQNARHQTTTPITSEYDVFQLRHNPHPSTTSVSLKKSTQFDHILTDQLNHEQNMSLSRDMLGSHYLANDLSLIRRLHELNNLELSINSTPGTLNASTSFSSNELSENSFLRMEQQVDKTLDKTMTTLHNSSMDMAQLSARFEHNEVRGRVDHPAPSSLMASLNFSNESMVIKDIAIGDHFSLLLLENGEVYACGRNLGQLGLGNKKATVSFVPMLFPFAELGKDYVVEAIFARYHQTFLRLRRLRDRRVCWWACGDNKYGQLGVDSVAPEMQPYPIQFTRPYYPTAPVSIDHVSIGGRHSFFLSKRS